MLHAFITGISHTLAFHRMQIQFDEYSEKAIEGYYNILNGTTFSLSNSQKMIRKLRGFALLEMLEHSLVIHLLS